MIMEDYGNYIMNKTTHIIKYWLLSVSQMGIVSKLIAGTSLRGGIILFALFILITHFMYKLYGAKESNNNIIFAVIIGVIERITHL